MKQFILLLLATVAWGVWGFASKIASEKSPSFAVLVAYSFAWVIFLPIGIYLSYKNEGFGTNTGFVWGFISGFCGVLGTLTFMIALKWGASFFGIVMVSTYPLITLVLLAITGKEHLTIYHLIGALLVIIGLLIMQFSNEP